MSRERENGLNKGNKTWGEYFFLTRDHNTDIDVIFRVKEELISLGSFQYVEAWFKIVYFLVFSG